MSYPNSNTLNSRVSSIWDYNDPVQNQILWNENGTFGKPIPTMHIFQGLGSVKPIKDIVWSSYAKEKTHVGLTIKANVSAGAAGASVTITLADALVTDGGLPSVVGDILVDENGIFALVTATDASAQTLTIQPQEKSGVAQILGPYAIGDAFVPTTAAFGLGTGTPKGIVVGYVEREFNMQIIKVAVKATGGSEKQEPIWKMYDDKRQVISQWSDAEQDCHDRLERLCSGAVTVGEKSTNLSSPLMESGETAISNETIEGMFPYYSRVGTEVDLSSNPLDMDTFYELGEIQDKKGLAGNVANVFMCGGGFMNDVEQVLNENVNATAVDFRKPYGSVKVQGGKSVSDFMDVYNVSHVSIAGRVNTFVKNDEWSDEDLFAHPNLGLYESAVAIPFDNYVDGYTNEVKKTMCVRPYEGRFNFHWKDGVAGSEPRIGTYDMQNHGWLRHFGLEMMKGQMGAVFTK